MTDTPNDNTDSLGADQADGGADQSAPPSAADRLPSNPATDAQAAAKAYAEAAADEVAPSAAGEPAPERTREELELLLAETQVALSMAEAQRDEHLNDLQRKAAELSNVLKREERNAGAGRVEGRIDVLRALIDVVDDFDRTMEAVAKSEDEALRSGVSLLHEKLAAALGGQGLVRTGVVGEPFDPNRHEAVQQIDAEDGPLAEPLIAEVYRSGYLVGERVVRAAMVVVKQ